MKAAIEDADMVRAPFREAQKTSDWPAERLNARSKPIGGAGLW